MAEPYAVRSFSPSSTQPPGQTGLNKNLVEDALSKSTIFEQCHYLTEAIRTASGKDLATSFQRIVYRIFGFKDQAPGWGLETMSSSIQKRDFDAVMNFLSPSGPFFAAIDKLLTSCDAQFELPLACLPAATRRRLEEGGPLSELYANKLHFFGHTTSDCVVVLDAFELYFCHFAYVLVRKEYKLLQYAVWRDAADWVYAALLVAYLDYFLPLKGVMPPLPYGLVSCLATAVTPRGASPASPLPSSASLLHRTASALLQSPLKRTQTNGSSPMGLLRPGGLLLQRSLSQQQASAAGAFDQPEAELWRSEKLLQVLVEFWLNQVNLDFKQRSLDEFLPSQELVWIVRIMVKHMHYFANSGGSDKLCSGDASGTYSPGSNAQQPVLHAAYERGVGPTALATFKCTFMARYVQRHLYAFLRYCFEKWPLDTSFHIVLEAWLTTIQPWRYINRDVTSAEDEEKECDSSWDGFILNNFIFYTVLLQDIFCRMTKVDLSSPKMAFMLFRVTKVLSKGCLVRSLQTVEEALLSVHSSSYRTSPLHGSDGAQQSIALLIASQISELESPNFDYRPLFSSETRALVQHLLQQAVGAVAATRAELDRRSGGHGMASSPQPQTSGSGGLLSWIGLSSLSVYNETSGSYCSGVSSEPDLFDLQKVLRQLSFSVDVLAAAFRIPVPSDYMDSCLDSSIAGSTSFSSPHTPAPDHVETERGVQLTELGRWQLINGTRKLEVFYMGDPELQPIRSYEIACLVRLLYKVSRAVNEKYGHHFKSWCSRQDFLGRIARQYLSAPAMAQSSLSPSRGKVVTGRGRRCDEPRLSLRIFANYYILLYMGVLFLLLSFVLGRWPAAASVMVGAAVVYSLVGASLERPAAHHFGLKDS